MTSSILKPLFLVTVLSVPVEVVPSLLRSADTDYPTVLLTQCVVRHGGDNILIQSARLSVQGQVLLTHPESTPCFVTTGLPPATNIFSEKPALGYNYFPVKFSALSRFVQGC